MSANNEKKGEVSVAVQETTEEVDFSKIEVKEALKLLNTTHKGLTSEEAKKRLEEYGPNKLPESTRIPILVFLGYMWNPLAWAMEAAAIIAICVLDYADFALIVALLLVNSCISYYEESNADKAIKALTAALAPKALCVRDGSVTTVDAVELVPGDVIIIRLGNIVPADVKILEEEGAGVGEEVPMQIDQAALTGESLPAKKFTGDVAFSGSSVKQGERHAVVYATGLNTFFGRAAALISATNNVANLQIVMNRIGAVCLGTILVWVTIELAVQFGHYDHACTKGVGGCPTITNMLVIIVGGIPIAMPTVLSVTLALGAYTLAKEGAIVARMSAVEEMAGMDVLCSDKTGTLTLNKLSVELKSVACLGNNTTMEVLKHAALSANTVTEEPIDVVLFNSYPDADKLKEKYTVLKFVPFNPVDKFTAATVREESTGKVFRLLKGSPQVVVSKAHNKDEIKKAMDDKMIEFANRGFRSLGLARAEGDGVDGNTKWEMLGMLPLFDPPRHDTKDTVHKCMGLGIEVKMITGDHLLIGKETAKMLGMGTEMYASEILIKAKQGHKEALQGHKDVQDLVKHCNGFAEVFPEHKFEIVKILQDMDHTVGMTGDGVNDAPALKKADVGIAVAGATDAARGAADIVLTEPGLSTIVTAVLGARKIFQRMTTYAKYTVAMTFRICFTFGLITVIYDWYFPTILIVIMAVFNDGAMIALSKDRVVASKTPNSWDLRNIFLMGIVYGLYLTLSTWVLYQVACKSSFFENSCSLFSLDDRENTLDMWCTSKITDLANEDTSGTPNRYGLTENICSIYGPEEYGGDGQLTLDDCQGITQIDQCITEQKYVRGGMLRSLLYNQVSISGQALVFVVRTQSYSFFARAGTWTYLAFILAQIGSTCIALFGFGGYEVPPDGVDNCVFCSLSSGGTIPFFPSGAVPRANTESAYTASVIGCTGYVIVAWIWSAIWYMGLDPIKWALCWVLNDDGFRDAAKFRADQRRHNAATPSLKASMEMPAGVQGFASATYSNPLGRASLSKPVSAVLDRKSAAIVAINRASGGAQVSADHTRAMDIARRSFIGPTKDLAKPPITELARTSLTRKSKTIQGPPTAHHGAHQIVGGITEDVSNHPGPEQK